MANKKTVNTARPGLSVIPTELSYGEKYKAVIADIPEASFIALAARGFSHMLGNEVASKVTAAKKKFAEANEALLAEDEESYNEALAENVEALEHQYREEFLAKIMGGTLGVRATGPRGSAIETVMRAVAIEELRAALGKKNVKWPAKADDELTVGGKVYTRTGLVDAYLEKHGEKLRAEAERRANVEEIDLDL